MGHQPQGVSPGVVLPVIFSVITGLLDARDEKCAGVWRSEEGAALFDRKPNASSSRRQKAAAVLFLEAIS